MPTKGRTIYYERAVWPEATEVTLQDAVNACLAVRPNANDTCLSLRDGHAEVRHRRQTGDGLYLHIAAWMDQESMSTVPHPSPAQPSADLDEQRPGTDWDFLDGDGMVLICGNHCLTMPSGLHRASIARFLRTLISAGRDEGSLARSHPVDFELLPIANPDVARRVAEQGVKRLHFDVGQFFETAREHDDRQRRTIVQQLGANIKATLKSLITDDADRRRVEEAENLHAKLVISIDSRRRGLTHEVLKPLAHRIIEEGEEGIEIETKTGQRIRHGELLERKPVKVAAFAKTVHHNHAWEQMQEFFAELRKGGALEQ